MKTKYIKNMDKFARANEIFHGLSKEIYYGLNFKIILTEASDQEIKVINGIIKKAEQERGAE